MQFIMDEQTLNTIKEDTGAFFIKLIECFS